MAEIVAFPKDEKRLVWVCGCGCSTFQLLSDNTIRCGNCDLESMGEWRKELPDDPIEVNATDSGTTKVTHLGDPIYALKSVLNKLDIKQVCGLVIIHADGHIHSWNNGETKKEQLWLSKQLNSVKRAWQDRWKNSS